MSSENEEGEAAAAPDAELEAAQEKYDRAQKISRRILYVLLFGAGFAIFIPMVVGAIQGVQNERIWDPLTGLPVAGESAELDCLNEAGDLIYLAGEAGQYDGRWEQRYRRWRVRCHDDDPELYHLLTQTRERLRGDERPPDMDDAEEG